MYPNAWEAQDEGTTTPTTEDENKSPGPVIDLEPTGEEVREPPPPDEEVPKDASMG